MKTDLNLDHSREHILIVDDKPDNLRLLSNMLTGQGYKVRLAPNGKLALSGVQGILPDLILMDIRMPGMDGFTVCEKLKADERTRDVPVIFLSASDELADKVKAFSIGGVDYITKPFQEEEVLTRLKTHLSLWNIQKQLEEKNRHLKETEERLIRQNESLTALHQLSLDMLSQRDVTALLQKMLDGAASLTRMSDGFIYLCDPGTSELEIRFGIGRFKQHIGFRLKSGEGLSGKVLKTGQPMLIDNYSTWEGRVPTSEFDGVYSVAGIPLKSGDQIEGVIGLANYVKGKTIDSHQISILELFANLASVAIDNARLYKTMQNEIAERRKAEEELLKAKEAAENANRTKSEFLANMSHEIRTPMNSVLGFLELSLEDPNLPQNQRLNLNTAFRSAKNLLALLNDILDLSKLESGKIELEKQPFDLREMMSETLNVFEIKCREKGLELTCAIHPAVSGCCIGDITRLRQIVINLVGNAVKFTEKGRISVSVEPLPDGMFHFSVSDTGIGIPVDKLGSIFDPFMQADSSTVRRFGGTGLGTTISKQLAELMGGKIWAESENGKGSTFHFTVKLETSGTDQSECHKSITELPRVKRRFKVLLAEDIEENILLTKIRLEQQGHTVIEARNGKQAVAAFQRECPDIILMDVHMPEMDGIEATRLIRKYELKSKNPSEQEISNSSRVPIVALTASVTSKEHQNYLQAEMDDVVAKPIDFDELLAVMEKVVPFSGEQRREDSVPAAEYRALEENMPILVGIDWKKGLKTWQNEAAYRKSLLSFCRDYEAAADKLRSFLESGDRESAYRSVHALKGVAGNLCVTEVFRIASNLNAEIKTKPSDELMPEIESLSRALNSAVSSIRRLIPPEMKPPDQSRTVSSLNPSELKEIFFRISETFELYNPDIVEPFLQKLECVFPPQMTEPIRRHLSLFDFAGAKKETLRLAAEVGIDLMSVIE